MTDEEHSHETIRRRQAKSGGVDYGDPAVLHDSKSRRLVVVPFFIPHSDHTSTKCAQPSHSYVNFWTKVRVPNPCIKIDVKSTLGLFGNAYVVRDAVREISTGDTLDLMLPSVIAGYRDIVELKRPDMEVLYYDEPHKNYYFSSEVSKAIGQCHRYLDVLHDVAAKGLRDHPEVVAYHPRAIIVIGRSRGWAEQHRALHGLNRRLSGLTVMTYDHLLTQGERLVEMLGPKSESGAELDEFLSSGEPFGDDIPF